MTGTGPRRPRARAPRVPCARSSSLLAVLVVTAPTALAAPGRPHDGQPRDRPRPRRHALASWTTGAPAAALPMVEEAEQLATTFEVQQDGSVLVTEQHPLALPRGRGAARHLAQRPGAGRLPATARRSTAPSS